MANRENSKKCRMTFLMTQKDEKLLNELSQKFNIDKSNLMRMILHRFENCELNMGEKS